jgi:hypothetical protein
MDEDNKKDHIANILNITPRVRENGVVIYQEPKEGDTEAETDVNYVRSMMYDTIATTKDALDEILSIAKQSQHPRAFEVVANLLNTMRDANKDLLDLHKTKKELRQEDKPESPGTINQNLFVGSTKELLDMIRGKNGN